jgi:hypothetical protein
MFSVRYELNSYILFRRNLVFKGLIIFPVFHIVFMRRMRLAAQIVIPPPKCTKLPLGRFTTPKM